jgi:putative RNA 2'-phosphotransferase
MSRHAVAASKFLAKVLRHSPGLARVTLDAEGWASIAELEQNTAGGRTPITRAVIGEIQQTIAKARFEVSPDGARIRALHGHSLDVELAHAVQPPPPVLYHGTAAASLPGIRARGLVPMGRKFVHLTTDAADAVVVARRHGKPVLLTVAADRMAADGVEFCTPGNGIWLVAAVDPKYIDGL